MALPFASFFLWSISKQGKTGAPTINLKENSSNIDTIITKMFKQYGIPLMVSDNICAIFRIKLWQMGKLICKLGGAKRTTQLHQWKDGNNSTWKLHIGDTEMKAQLLHKRRNFEDQLKKQSSKW